MICKNSGKLRMYSNMDENCMWNPSVLNEETQMSFGKKQSNK